MKIENKKYTAGDLARFYGISVDTVRLYDKKGLLCPYLKDKNNYRLYTRNDLIALEYILRLKNAGISLAEIDDIVNHSVPSAVLDLCNERIEEIDLQITNLSGERKRLETYIDEVSIIDVNAQITVMLNPPFFLKEITQDIPDTSQWLMDHDLSEMYKIASYNEFPTTPTDLEHFNSMQTRAEWVDFYLMTPVSQNQIHAVQSQITDSSKIFPSQLCLHGICKANYTDDHIFLDYSRFYEFALKHNFKLKPNVLSSITFIEDLQHQKIYHCEVWWPIEE
ncbi:helix-turn-helix domain-containing protein [Anaerotignum sp.]